MSEASVSTTSSRIKQFGLYRTIDARTEEFLRLSRKRQLRQGCACAAVSTAITVTIVVSVILIYEYGIISEFSSKSTLRSNWLGLMNTSEAMPFEAKFNKASINLESSIRLLPLVLKALKKNRYYDNIMEDDSSPNPFYEKKDPDDLLSKNIYSDSRNWMRIPTSRIYAIEYKTSPILYYKNPTRNTDYFTKIRRIRDYQRIMNYVDKMISERITGSTMPMLKSSYAFDKNLPIPYTTPMSSVNHKIKHNINSNPKELINNKKPKCSCPKKMNDLLNKMIVILQKLLPNETRDILTMPKACDHSKKQIANVITKSPQTTTGDHIKPKINLKTVNPNALPESKKLLEIILPTATKGKLKQAAYLLKSLPTKVDYSLQTIIKLIRPKKFKGNTIKDFNVHKSINIKQPPESTEDYYFSPEDTTKSLPKVETNSNVSESVTETGIHIVVSEDFLNTTDSDITTSTLKTLPTLNEETDDINFVENTTSHIINSYNSLDIHSLELVKSKMIPNDINMNTKGEKPGNNEESELLNYDKIKMFKNSSLISGLLRKMGQLIKSTSVNSEINEEFIDDETNDNVIPNSSPQNKNYLYSINSFPDYSKTVEYLTTTPLYATRKNDLIKNEADPTFKLEDVTLEEEEEKMSFEDSMTSNNVKKLEKIINLLNNSEIDQNNMDIKTPPSPYQWENVTIEDNNSTEETTKHNIPKSRSSYLEIQRNDWNHEEHQDYDNNNY